MSLNVTLTRTQETNVYELCGLTHNLTAMAEEAGIYKVMWRPEELDFGEAGELIPDLERGLALLMEKPERFKKLNPKNGWGDYEGFVKVVRKYLSACKTYPDAKIWVSR